MVRLLLALALTPTLALPLFAADPEKVDLFHADTGGYKQYRIPASL